MATSPSRPDAGRLYAKTAEEGSRRPAPFRRVLVANRGEIAVRIIRACHDMGMEAVAVYSDADAGAAHVRLADEAVRIGPAPSSQSYLLSDAIVAAAEQAGAQAVHPGYGFLAEQAAFARAVRAAGLVFVGPSTDAIAALGDKLAARRAARDAGVPIVPGTLDPALVDRPDRVDAILAEAEAIGFPLLVKAAAGGGGRGMRRVTEPAELVAALAAGAHEAASAFGSGAVYLEREIRPARHIEVQLLGDSHGDVVALGERDCSIQRRHQKLIEESPAPGLADAQRAELHEMAIRIARAAGLTNAATAEFLVDPEGGAWFLEVNARLQVEHGLTELVTGLDLVREQFHLAAGEALAEPVRAAAARATRPMGHAIEARISAEDPAREFAPAPGRVGHWRMPAGPGVRVDTAVEAGERIPPDYDPLIAKLMVHAGSRDEAVDRLRRALDEVEIAGIQTTLPFHRAVVRDAAFRAGDLSTDWVAERWDGPADRARAMVPAIMAAGLASMAGQDGRVGPTAVDGGPALAADGTPGRSADDRRATSSGPDGWRRAGRDAALDRWPR